MQEPLGHALSEFHIAFLLLEAQLGAAPLLRDALLADTEEWVALLTHKLLPHFEGEGCLVVAVAGGTNTGKSTLFNVLLGEDISPIRNTAAATSRPLMAGSPRRHEECLAGRLFPEFAAEPLRDAEAVVQRTSAAETLFAVPSNTLSDRLVLLDTPDVDSIDRQNWQVAENIRAAGDVLVAILTGEKYKDERVVEFFRRARQAGRVILPLMNKANPENDFEVARLQLHEFCMDVGLEEAALFAMPHDFSLAKQLKHRKVIPLSQGVPLRDYLDQLDVQEIKRRVYRDTVAHFGARAGGFVTNARMEGARLRQVVQTFEAQAREIALQYQPAPGAAVGGLFHEFVQSKRKHLGLLIGKASRSVMRGAGALGGVITRAVRRGTTLETPSSAPDEKQLRVFQSERIEVLTRHLVQRYYETVHALHAPADLLVQEGLDALDMDAVVAAVTLETLRAENISEAFRAHAQRQLDEWWEEHTGRRRAVQALDNALMVAPWAIAGVMAAHTAGFGVPETMMLVGPVAEQFASNVVQYQFGDRLFDFISPWQREQQEALEIALHKHVLFAVLGPLMAVLEPLEQGTLDALEQWRTQCLNLI